MKSKAIGPLFVFLLTLAIVVSRAPDRIFDGFLWAEDATVFVRETYIDGWRSLFEQYSRYAHFFPHLIAYITLNAAPVGALPYIFPCVCAVVSAIGAAYSFSAVKTLSIIPEGNRTTTAALVALAPWLVPHSGEVYLTVANLQWLMCPVLLVLLWDSFGTSRTSQESIGATLARAFAVACLAMTGPFGVFLWPVAAGLLATDSERRRSTRRIGLFIIYSAAAAFQLSVMMRKYPATPLLHDLNWVHDFAVHLFADLFLPQSVLTGISFQKPLGLALFAVVLLIILTSKSRYYGLFLGAFGIFLWMGAMVRINTPDQPFLWYAGGSRYIFLPSIMMLWSLTLAAATHANKTLRNTALFLCIAMLLTSASHFGADQYKKWKIEYANGKTELTVPPGLPVWQIELPDR